jgi:hypothetical protein
MTEVGSPLFPKRVYLAADPRLTVARATLGVTLYLDDPHAWAAGGWTALFDAFLARAPAGRLHWFTTSMLPEWKHIRPSELPQLREHLAADTLLGRMRHLFSFEIADDRYAPSVGFRYREIDPARSNRTAWLQLLLPPETPADELLALMIEIGQLYRVYSGIAGWTASYSRAFGGAALEALWGTCKRYIGLDVQSPDHASRRAATWLPSTSWLTLLGSRFAGEAIEAVGKHEWRTSGSRVLPLRHGTLVKAGAAPELGDTNGMEYPAAQSEAAQVLSRWTDPAPAPLGAAFDEEATSAWVHRFAHHEAWI